MATKKPSKKKTTRSSTGRGATSKAAKQTKPVTMSKAEAVNAAMLAVEADKKKRSTGLDAAAAVLANADEPLGCKQIVERMLAKGLWKTTGKTPWATIYSSITREIVTKGKDARFRKVARGKFILASSKA